MSRARASEQVLSVIPVAIWDSEMQQFDKPFRTVVLKVGSADLQGPAEGHAGGQSMHMKRDNLISILFISLRSTQRERENKCFYVALLPPLFTANNNMPVLNWTPLDQTLLCEPYLVVTRKYCFLRII